MAPPGYKREFKKMTSWRLACEMKSNAMLKTKCAYLVAKNETMKMENRAMKEENEALIAENDDMKTILQILVGNCSSPTQPSSYDASGDPLSHLFENSAVDIEHEEEETDEADIEEKEEATGSAVQQCADPLSRLFENSALDIEHEEEETDEGDIEEKKEAGGSAVQHSAYPRTVWAHKCAVCHQSIRGGHIGYRYGHIAVHEKIRFPCVVAGCQVTQLYAMFCRHIARVHQMSSKTLSVEEKQRLEVHKKRYKEQVAPHLATYFPEGRVLVEQKKRRGTVNPTCKACGREIVDSSGRVKHIAKHIGETITCPIADCWMQVHCLTSHMKKKHGYSIKSLRGDAKNRYDAAFSVWMAHVDASYSQYFS